LAQSDRVVFCAFIVGAPKRLKLAAESAVGPVAATTLFEASLWLQPYQQQVSTSLQLG
jgi:hypothetical protein